jgi:hypothetical protein
MRTCSSLDEGGWRGDQFGVGIKYRVGAHVILEQRFGFGSKEGAIVALHTLVQHTLNKASFNIDSIIVCIQL